MPEFRICRETYLEGLRTYWLFLPSESRASSKLIGPSLASCHLPSSCRWWLQGSKLSGQCWASWLLLNSPLCVTKCGIAQTVLGPGWPPQWSPTDVFPSKQAKGLWKWLSEARKWLYLFVAVQTKTTSEDFHFWEAVNTLCIYVFPQNVIWALHMVLFTGYYCRNWKSPWPWC